LILEDMEKLWTGYDRSLWLCRHSWLGFLHGDVLLFKESEKDDIRFQKW